MKHPIPEPSKKEYDFKRLTPVGYSVKDSCSFTYLGDNYILCTYVGIGGLALFKEVLGTYHYIQTIFKGWTDMWAPCVIEENGKLVVFCSDTGGAGPFWRTQRIKYFEFEPGWQPNNPTEVVFDDPKGMIDPEVIKIGEKYYLFYVIMDWNTGEWWDVYYSTSDNLLGPYHGEYNISQMIETGIEEAPHVIGDKLYWSVGDSQVDSHIRRGDLISNNNILNVSEDTNVKIKAVGSPVCTHPGSFEGKLRATLKDGNEFYIGELV